MNPKEFESWSSAVAEKIRDCVGASVALAMDPAGEGNVEALTSKLGDLLVMAVGAQAEGALPSVTLTLLVEPEMKGTVGGIACNSTPQRATDCLGYALLRMLEVVDEPAPDLSRLN